MELCVVNSTKLLSLNPKIHLFVPRNTVSLTLKNPFLQFSKNIHKRPLNSSLNEFPSFSRQIQPLVSSPRTSSLVKASSAASGVETEKLPADINVIETPEPNSRVRFWCLFMPFLSIFTVILMLFLSLTYWIYVGKVERRSSAQSRRGLLQKGPKGAYEASKGNSHPKFSSFSSAE